METKKIKNFNNKKAFLILSVLFLLMSFVNGFIYLNTNNVLALSNESRINIDVKEGNVVNLIYKVVDQNNNLIKSGIRFNLIDRKTNKIIATKEIENIHDDNYDGPLLIFENISFGSYVMSPSSNQTFENKDKISDLKGDMYVDTDKNYMDKQHVIKDYVVFVKNESNYRENNVDQRDLGNGTTEFIISDISNISNISNEENETKNDKKLKKVKTGDNTVINRYLFGFAVSIIFLIILLIHSKKVSLTESLNENSNLRNGVNGNE